MQGLRFRVEGLGFKFRILGWGILRVGGMVRLGRFGG